MSDHDHDLHQELALARAEAADARAKLQESEQRYQALLVATEWQQRILVMLDQVHSTLATEIELDQVFFTVVHAIHQAFGYTQVSLYLREGDELVLQHQVGYDHVIDRISVYAGVSGRVVQTGQAVLIKDVHQDPAFLGAIDGIVSEICVPLFQQKQVVGILNVESVGGVRLSEADLHLITGLSDHIRIAIERAQHVLTYTEDIAKLRQTEAALAQARDAALESSRLKSEFLATVSHEIRTPMNGVIGMTELLLDTILDNEQREFAQTISDSANALLVVINDILDYSKIESGRLQLDRVPVSLVELVGGVNSLLRAHASAKGVALVAEIGGGVPPYVRGDPGRLRQVLLNLVGNAVKFTERGRISVRVAADADHDDAVVARFTVMDTGIGISDAARQRLFQPFTQVDGSAARRHGGTGLGLAISKSLVELMGGSIGCESVSGSGSTFWFTLRLSKTDAPDTREQPGPSPDRRLTPALPQGRVLLVEDQPVNQAIALRQLVKLGCRVDLAGNGREAVELISNATGRYQIILMDCHMPELDGYEATRAIRAIELARGGHIPIIAMTASAMHGEREACIDAGMDDFLGKPVRLEDLRTVISRWIGAALSGATTALLRSAEPRAAVDRGVLDDLRALDVGQAGVLGNLVQIYRAEGQILLAKMREIVATDDLRTLTETAHRMRGSSASLGAARLADLCSGLEVAGRAGNRELAAALLAQAEASFVQVGVELEAACAQDSV